MIILIICLLATSCCKQVTESTSSIVDSIYKFKQLKDTTLNFKSINTYTIVPKSTGDTSYSEVEDNDDATVIKTVTKKDGTVVVKHIVKPKPITITKIKEVVVEKKAKEVIKTTIKTVTKPTKPWYFYPTIIIAILIGIYLQRLFNVTTILRKLFTWFI